MEDDKTKWCGQCCKTERETVLVEKKFKQNGEWTKRWFCSEGSCYGHYMMGLEG